MSDLPERDLHVWQMVDGPDMVVAHDEDDAWAVWCTETGERREDHEPEGGWHQWPDDKELPITEVDEPGQPCTTKTGKQWAQEAGRRLLASTEY